MQNLMSEYVKIVKSNMSKYIKSFVDNKYVKSISDEFIDTYTEIRYYGLIEVKKGFTVKNKILTELRKKKDELLADNPEKQKNIEIIYAFIDCAISLNEIEDKNIDEEIKQIVILRKEHLSKAKDEKYIEDIHSLVKNCEKEKEKLLKLAKTEKFNLKFSNCKISNLKRVKLKYNLKFPAIYSKDAIEKAFNTGIIAEDKIFVEYNLIAAQIIKDVQDGIYRKQYIVEFPDSILEKNQKLLRLLEILNHPSIQDRVMIELNYSAFVKNKEKIYELLKNGYKFALLLDDSFEISASEMQRLSMFQYVLVSRKHKCYDELVKNRQKNLLEI